MNASLLFLAMLTLVPTALANSEGLQAWLKDSNARQALQDAWGSGEHPLASAVAALNLSAANADYPKLKSVSNECLRDVNNLLSSKQDWAIKMLDSSVKVPEGLLNLQTIHFGNWDECVSVGDDPFKGQMCLVTLYLGGERELNEIRAGPTRGGALALVSALSLSLGTCVPSTCSPEDVQALFTALVNPLPAVQGLKLRVFVGEQVCTTRDRPSLDTSDWVGVGLLCALAAVLVLSTAYDLLIPAVRRKPVLAAFSVVANGRKLLAAPRSGSDQTLSCLHGIRVLSMCWIVLGHRFALSTGLPALNPLYVYTFLDHWYNTIITNADIAVDTFLMLSGLLVGYLFFKQAPSKRRLNIPMYYLHRYIRLTPALAMMILLVATVLVRMGWGPLWVTTTSAAREICRDNWWHALLYVANYVEPSRQCMGQSWYLMVDMQLHWLSPIVLLPLARWRRVGAVLLGCLCIGGILSNFILAFENEYPGHTFNNRDPDTNVRYFLYFYIPTYTRFVPYLVGLATGYIVAVQRVDKKKPVAYVWLTSALAWLATAVLLVASLMTGYSFVLSDPPLAWTSLYNAVHRSTWALGVAGMVHLCASGRGGPVNAFLSWSGFQVLSRFCFGVYLVHEAVQVLQAAGLKTSVHISSGSIVVMYAGDLLLAFAFGGLLCLLCESPFLVLEKELLGRLGRKAPASAPAATSATSPVSALSSGVTSYPSAPVSEP